MLRTPHEQDPARSAPEGTNMEKDKLQHRVIGTGTDDMNKFLGKQENRLVAWKSRGTHHRVGDDFQIPSRRSHRSQPGSKREEDRRSNLQ